MSFQSSGTPPGLLFVWVFRWIGVSMFVLLVGPILLTKFIMFNGLMLRETIEVCSGDMFWTFLSCFWFSVCRGVELVVSWRRFHVRPILGNDPCENLAH